MNTLFIIRHGSTAFNEAHRYCGSTDCSLSSHGRNQVARLGSQFNTVPLTRVVHSPMHRCVESATAVAKENNLPLESVSDLREIDFGDWEGLTFNEAHAQYPADAKALLAGNPSFSFPNGESAVELHQRVSQAFKSILPIDGPTALVAHGGTIRVLLIEMGLLTFEKAFSFPVECTSITAIDVDGEHYTLRSANGLDHLSEGVNS